MPKLTSQAKRFVSNFESRHRQYNQLAEALKEEITDVVSGLDVAIESINSRAKSADSVRGKLRDKDYANPARRLPDAVGARIICYYANDVDTVARVIAGRYTVNDRQSIDKRGSLQADQFGYRSVHLVVDITALAARRQCTVVPGNKWAEIQIRSLIDNVWATISHDLFYKSGIELPAEKQRVFNAAAGALEILDDAFSRQRDIIESLLVSEFERYRRDGGLFDRIDAVKLVSGINAFFPPRDPPRLSVGAARIGSLPFAMGRPCLDALAESDVRTGKSLKTALCSEHVLSRVSDYAALVGESPGSVSDFAVAVMVASRKSKSLIPDHYPELLQDPKLRQVVLK